VHGGVPVPHTLVCGIHPQRFWLDGRVNYFSLQTAYGVFNILTNFLVWLAPLNYMAGAPTAGAEVQYRRVFTLGAL
jgi:hypothetical protein